MMSVAHKIRQAYSVSSYDFALHQSWLTLSETSSYYINHGPSIIIKHPHHLPILWFWLLQFIITYYAKYFYLLLLNLLFGGEIYFLWIEGSEIY